MFYSSTCDSIEQTSTGVEVRASVHVSGSSGADGGDKKVFRPRLLVGADGLKSMVSGWRDLLFFLPGFGRREDGTNKRAEYFVVDVDFKGEIKKRIGFVLL